MKVALAKFLNVYIQYQECNNPDPTSHSYISGFDLKGLVASSGGVELLILSLLMSDCKQQSAGLVSGGNIGTSFGFSK